MSLVEFVVKMRETMSGGMRNIASVAQSSFAKVNTNIDRTAAKLRTPIQSVNTLNNRLDDLKRTRDLSINMSQVRAANREIERTERQLGRLENAGRRGGSSSGGGILGMLGGVRGMAAAAGIAGAVALGAGATKVAGMGMKGNAQKTSFEVMAGQQPGGKLYNDLNKFAQDSIFGTELHQNAQTMLAFGANVKEVLPDLRMLGDISMGNKEKLGSLTLAFSQIRASGRLMGQDLLQLINAGFNPLQVVSEKTGRSMGQLKEDMEKGKISFTQVKAAFEAATAPGGKFFEMTKKIGETPFGKWQAFQGQLEGIGLQLGTAMLPLVSKTTDALASLAGHLPGIINNLQPFFDMLSGLQVGDQLSSFFEMVSGIGTALLPVFVELKPLVTTLFDVISPLAIKVREFAVTLVQRLAPTLTNIASILSSVLTPALKIAGWLLGKILDVATWAVDKIAYMTEGISSVLKFVYGGVGKVLDGVAGLVTQKTNAVTAAIKRGVSDGSIVSFFKKVGETHGGAYVTGILAQYQRVAAFMDKMYNSTAFTTRFKQLAGQITGNTLQEVTVIGKRKSSAAGAGGAGLDGLSSGSSTSDKITGGGSRKIEITVHKMLDNITIHAANVQEGMNNVETIVQEALLRILGSAGKANL